MSSDFCIVTALEWKSACRKSASMASNSSIGTVPLNLTNKELNRASDGVVKGIDE